MLEFLLPNGLLDADPPYWYAVIRQAEFSARTYDGVRRPAGPSAETRIVVLEPGGEGAAGGTFVARYDAAFGYIADEWYATRELAVEEVTSEFGGALGQWMSVPEQETDPEGYILASVARGGAG